LPCPAMGRLIGNRRQCYIDVKKRALGAEAWDWFVSDETGDLPPRGTSGPLLVRLSLRGVTVITAGLLARLNNTPHAGRGRHVVRAGAKQGFSRHGSNWIALMRLEIVGISDISLRNSSKRPV